MSTVCVQKSKRSLKIPDHVLYMYISFGLSSMSCINRTQTAYNSITAGTDHAGAPNGQASAVSVDTADACKSVFAVS